MLYTIMPMEFIVKNISEKPNRQTTVVNGVMLECERNGEYLTVTRIVSSDPKIYLDKNIYPGKKIKLSDNLL